MDHCTYRYSKALKWVMPSGRDVRWLESKCNFLTFFNGWKEFEWSVDNSLEDRVLWKKKNSWQHWLFMDLTIFVQLTNCSNFLDCEKLQRKWRWFDFDSCLWNGKSKLWLKLSTFHNFVQISPTCTGCFIWKCVIWKVGIYKICCFSYYMWNHLQSC